MNTELVLGLVVLALVSYWNSLILKRFDNYRRRANERLARLEEAAESNGWKLPMTSFGFFTDEDTY